MQYCKRCVTPITRPRVVFTDGVCNGCLWAEEKKTINWDERRERLQAICNQYRSQNYYDIVVPVSGGKDGSYVAWKMKHEFGMHPLCVTFAPPIQTELGRQNLNNFRQSGFDLIEIRPNPNIYARLCKRMFIDAARSKFPFVIGIGTAVARIALQVDVPLIIYGEEGETEYGGSDKYKNLEFINQDYIQVYHEGHSVLDYCDEFEEHELYWWVKPPKMDTLKVTWWSKFESWDDKLHRDLAVEKCGLTVQDKQSIGTFTNYAQIDDVLQDLHMYECFLKYGTGRTTADCNLAIKGNRMTREQAVEYVNKYEGTFPNQLLSTYCQYFDMSKREFRETLDKHANKDILEFKGWGESRPWVLKNQIS